MLNRDQYFFDICREAGLDPSSQEDWAHISILFSDPEIKEAEESGFESK